MPLTLSDGAGQAQVSTPPKSAYRMMLCGTVQMEGAKQLWGAWAPPKVKLFMWLAMQHRLWTTECRQRHVLQASSLCCLCDQETETPDHLFAECSTTKQVWWEVLSWIGAGHRFANTASILEL
ncbi:hypothetical protein QOZ80_6AG0527250 [Eleusine coracana subsp. coracana]|nr:hypothetical protein QOZ80_6AG0527250 [Eleusine coracana subsp. coracana]